MHTGFFDVSGEPACEVLRPRPWALSQWGGGGQLRGMAVSGALARAAEHAANQPGGANGLRPVRWTLDLLRPASAAPCVATANVLRRGRRLCLVDATLRQNDFIVARSSALFLTAGGSPRGTVWSSTTTVSAPPPSLRPATTEPRLYYSEPVGWTGSPEPHQNSGRKRTWHFPSEVVRGEQPTPFQQAAMVADAANLVTNWGDSGLEFINADITLAMARLPCEEQQIGLAAEQRFSDDGVMVGIATVLDRHGTLGTATVTALLQGSSTVDPRQLGTDHEPPAAAQSRPQDL